MLSDAGRPGSFWIFTFMNIPAIAAFPFGSFFVFENFIFF
jgi:hypothetical protein